MPDCDRFAGEGDVVGVDGVVAKGHNIVVSVAHVETQGVLLMNAVQAVLFLCFPPVMKRCKCN